MKKISLVVPVYNVESYLKECMDAMLNQTIGLENIEIIAVNDGSTDGSYDILKEYEAAYPDTIVLVDIQPNKLPGYARNVGLTYASGQYTMFVDSDDVLFSNVLLEAAYILDNTNADLVEFGYCQGSDMNHLITACNNTGDIQVIEIKEDSERAVKGGLNDGYVWDKLFSTQYLKENQLYFAEGLYYEDTIFVLLVNLTYKKMIKYEKCLYAHRINNHGIMYSFKKDDYRQFDRCKVMVMAMQECLKRGLMDRYYHLIEYSFLHVYYGDTMYFVFERFEHLPEKQIREMQETVKALFPNYMDNPFVNKPDQQAFKGILKTVEMEFTEELFQMYKMKKS